MPGFAFVRRMWWRAIWLIGIHSLGLWMLADAREWDRRPLEGSGKSSYDTMRRD